MQLRALGRAGLGSDHEDGQVAGGRVESAAKRAPPDRDGRASSSRGSKDRARPRARARAPRRHRGLRSRGSWRSVSFTSRRRKSSSSATRIVFIARLCPCSIEAMRPALERGRSADRRAAAWLAAVAALAYLPFNHCHFSATDETGVFDPALALYERGTLAVEPGMHIFAGRDGRHYSHFAIAQTVLALPFIALADAFEARARRRARCAPRSAATTRAISIRARPRRSSSRAPMRRSPRVCSSRSSSCSSAASARRGAPRSRPRPCSRRRAMSPPTRSTSSSTRARRSRSWAGSRRSTRGGAPAACAWLAAGSLLASAVVIVRMPAAVSGPALAGYLAWTLAARAREPGFAPAARRGRDRAAERRGRRDPRRGQLREVGHLDRARR